MLEVAILDSNFNVVGQIDDYESLIWTDRYNDYGDFEVYARASATLLSMIQNGRYAQIAESRKVMFIEDISIETDAEIGDSIAVTGRSVESLFSRAIILNQILVENVLLQEVIQRILNENLISPSDSNRQIPNLIFQVSSDPKVTTPIVSIQLRGEEVLDTIKRLLDEASLGFEIIITQTHQFIFDIYAGVDRSRNQTVNPYIIFAPSNENISSSRYFESTKDLKKVAYVFATWQYESALDPENPKVMDKEEVVIVGNGSGLERRELYVDARDLSSQTEPQNEDEEPEYISEATFLNLMRTRGQEALKEHELVRTFDGEVDASREPKYGEDFFIGDLVEIANAYGMSSTARVVEVVRTVDASGYKEVPGFIML